MTSKPAKGIRGTLIDLHNDGRFVLRVYGKPDAVTGRKPYTDYELRVADLPVEITSDYYKLYEPDEPGSGVPCLDYARGKSKDRRP